jgi:osmotically-inducible protein OsmY
VKKALFILSMALFAVSYADYNRNGGCGGNGGNGGYGGNGNGNRGNGQMQSDSNSNQPSDWEITTKVKANIMSADLSASARLVSVTTNNGVVTLTGTVASREEARKIVEIAKGIRGVKRVDNQLTVSRS